MLELINLMFKVATEIVIEGIKYDSKNTFVSWVQTIEFLFTFFNSCIFILLINTNLQADGFHLSYLDGGYSDFNIWWYLNVAPFFITPFFIKYFLPFLGMTITITVKKVQQIWDRWMTVGYQTQTNSAEEYADLYSGTKPNLDDAYPKIMTVVVICMFYGVGLPVLFPLTLLYLLVLYVVHKVAAVYWF